jgi:glycogen debranching enzyme
MKKRVGDDWLIYNSGYVGTCVVAGHQDYPFYFGGDTEVSIAGLLAAGLHDTAKESLRLLGAVGKKQNGRIPHCVVTNGEVYDWGNIHESARFIRSAWDTYLWSGDENFLKEIYPICKMSINYILRQPRKDDIILQETGDNPDSPRARIIPTANVLGFEAFAKMAERIGDNTVSQKIIDEAKRMRGQIEDLFWVEEQNLYADSIDDKNNPAPGIHNQFWSYMHTSMIAAYCKVAEKSRVERALSKIEKPPYTVEWGIYLAPCADIMPYTTGKAAVAEFNYGRIEEGLRYIRMMAKTVGHIMPGAAPETISKNGDPKKFLPGWCYLQLWSASHINQGLIWGLLHPKPDAARNKMVLKPQLPKDWPNAEIKNLKVGKSLINVRLGKKETKIIHSKGPKLEIVVK